MFNAIFKKKDTASALGTFTVKNGNLLKGTTPLVTWFNDRAVIIGMSARASFTLPTEHQMFDQLLLEFMNRKIGIMYVDSLPAFMNPKARFTDFLEGTLDPATVGIVLTADEAKLPELYKGVTAKFKEVFTATKGQITVGGVDLTKYFMAEEIEAIEKWRADRNVRLPGSVIGKINSAGIGGAKAGLLRIYPRGNTTLVQNHRGDHVSKTRFLEAYNNHLQPRWASVADDPNNSTKLNNYTHRVEASENGSNYNRNNEVDVYPSYVRIGCQQIPRSEVERIVQLLTA